MTHRARRDRDAVSAAERRGQPAAAPHPLLALQASAGNTAVTRLVAERAGGAPLDPATRARWEQRTGADLSTVRVRLDAEAAAREGAHGYTVGDQVVLDPAWHRPGSLAGDALLGHEIAHVLQQRQPAGGGAPEHALEAEADQAALAATGPANGFVPRLRSALSLRRCRRDEAKQAASEKDLALAEKLKHETDPHQLAALLKNAPAAKLAKAEQAIAAGALPRGSMPATALAWERAFRARDYQQLSKLAADDQTGLRTPYGDRLHGVVMSGQTTITIEATDREFRDYVAGTMAQLMATASGLRLVTELLATGQPVTLKRGEGHSVEPTDPVQAGYTDVDQRGKFRLIRGEGSGSTVTLNPAPDAPANSYASPGTQAGQRTMISMDEVASVGHELIHALHNARGDNLAAPAAEVGAAALLSMPWMARDPATGGDTRAEELRTITGARTLVPLAGGPPVAHGATVDITENVLRRELGLPLRASHASAPVSELIERKGASTIDDLLARYQLPETAPNDARDAIRPLLRERALETIMEQLAPDSPVPVPHPEYIRLHLRYVEGNRQLADQLTGLSVK